MVNPGCNVSILARGFLPGFVPSPVAAATYKVATPVTTPWITTPLDYDPPWIPCWIRPVPGCCGHLQGEREGERGREGGEASEQGRVGGKDGEQAREGGRERARGGGWEGEIESETERGVSVLARGFLLGFVPSPVAAASYRGTSIIRNRPPP